LSRFVSLLLRGKGEKRKRGGEEEGRSLLSRGEGGVMEVLNLSFFCQYLFLRIERRRKGKEGGEGFTEAKGGKGEDRKNRNLLSVGLSCLSG